MEQNQFPVAPHFLTPLPSRRHLLRGLAGAGLAVGAARLPIDSGAKKRKPKRRKGLCRKNGTPCKSPGKSCQKRYCRDAAFTIEAIWTETANHDAFLWVPSENEATGPGPYVHHPCTQTTSRCDEAFPFACGSGDVSTTGAEVTTIFRLLPGSYEFWIEIDDLAQEGAVAVVLRNGYGRIVRRWSSPANATQSRQSWHVFDIDGRLGLVTAIDELIDKRIFTVKDPSTNVCPS
jgi:hypothetical protein